MAVNPATTFRANVPGDSWNYSVSIDFESYGTDFGTYTGTLNENLANDTYNNQPSVRSSSTFNLQLQYGPATITSYSELATTGGLLAEEENGNLVAVTGDTFSMPSTIGPDTNVSGTVTLAGGETIAESYKVFSKAQISTQAGTFECWLVAENINRSDGSSDTIKLWVAPETGNYVKVVDSTTNSDGETYTYTALLTSMVSP